MFRFFIILFSAEVESSRVEYENLFDQIFVFAGELLLCFPQKQFAANARIWTVKLFVDFIFRFCCCSEEGVAQR